MKSNDCESLLRPRAKPRGHQMQLSKATEDCCGRAAVHLKSVLKLKSQQEKEI